MNIKELMSEIDDELKGTFVSQETLEPNFWPLGRKLRPSIRKRLIEIAQDFFESLEIDAELKDITFTGSLANYNWSSYSDVDLHLIVENEPHSSTGVYSVMNDEWLIEPSRVEPSLDWSDITKKADNIMDQIDRATTLYKSEKYTEALQYIDKLREKIRKFRKTGLDRAGEFSGENIAFKVLRRNNYLEKLSNLKHMAYDKLMSKKSDDSVRVKLSETVKSWKEFLGN